MVWAWLWASPWSLLGLACGLLGLITGGHCRRWRHILEFHGGLLDRMLQRVPLASGASAITLGHVVLARNQHDLEQTRAHEWVHVVQYERWGPLFVPLYFGFWLWLTLRKRDGYWDNPFEVQARQLSETTHASDRPGNAC